MSEENMLSKVNNADYHRNRTHLSSSTLKTLLKSATKFHAEWFLGERESSEDKAWAVEGNFTHALILEPHKIEQEYAVYEGLRKAGNVFEAFKAENAHKKVISAVQVSRCEALYASFAKTDAALRLVQNGLPEHTLLSDINGVPVKMRADYIVPGKYIVDVKTTSGASDKEVFKYAIEAYGYALSAALYCHIADDTFKAKHDFYFVVLSKTDGGCRVYKASEALMNTGKGQLIEALLKYKRCLANNNWSDECFVPEWAQEIEEV